MAYQPKSYRKYLAGAAAAAVVASAVPTAGFAAASFTDTQGHWAAEAIDYLVGTKALDGMAPGIFAPEADLTRGQAAAVLARVLGLDIVDSAKTDFADTKDHWSSKYVKALQDYNSKIIGGYGDGTFQPEGSITRQELAKMVVTAFGYELDDTKDVAFDDNNSWGAEYVEILASLGIIGGYGDGTVLPGEKVSRAEAATFVYRSEVPAERIEVKDKEVEVVTPAVESVSAINAKQLVVKFTTAVEKDSVVAADETLVDGAFKLEKVAATSPSVSLDGAKAVLSADGKTLTITYATAGAAGEYANGDYVFSVVKNKVQTTNTTKTEYIPAYTSSTLVIKDTTNPTVVSTEKINATQYKLTFNEPIKSEGVISGTYADGSGVAPVSVATPTKVDQKTLTVTLTSTVGKNVNVTLVGVTDYNNNLVSPNPITFTAVKSDKDGVAPTATVKALSASKLEVKFSEEVQDFPAKADFTIDTVGLVAGDKVVQDTTDKTKYTIELATPLVAGFHNIAVAANKFYDLSGEGNAAHASTIQITADQTAPTLTNSKVVKERDGKEYLVLTFNKDVVLSGFAGAITVSGKSVKDYVTTSPVTFDTASAFVANGTNVRNEYKIALDQITTGGNGTALVKDTTYTIDLPANAVKTLTNTVGNEAKTNAITFTRGTDSAVTGLGVAEVKTNQASLTGGAAGKDILLANNKVTVTFDQTVDGASAIAASNYVVDGAVVKSAELAGDNKTVTLTLEDNKTTYSGARYLTITGVKTSAGLPLAETFKKAITLNENVAPTVTGVKINATTATTADVELTFSEVVSHTADTADFNVFVDGLTDANVSVATVTATATPTDKVVVKITLDDIAKLSSKTITLKANTSKIDFKDAAGNTVEVGTVTVK
ncbi:S-layer homology domain-containing protein [Niallia oryzisoli]|uniref:S-layer homology domain-containing protein n=1 Tax=Niallia oryzisoli TaxID=1737571 RepID=UPI003736E651